MNSDTIATIKDLLYTERAKLEEQSGWWTDGSGPQKRCQREIAEIDAALAALAALEQTQPAADVPLPDFQQTIEAERNIGFIEGVLEGVKARIQKDQPVLRSQEYTIRRCNEVQAWLQRQREAGE